MISTWPYAATGLQDLRATDFSCYESPMEIPEDSESRLTTAIDQVLAARILTALYSSDRAVGLLANSSKEYETLALQIWRQQWPEVQRRFTFSTGSLVPRRTEGKLFAFQVMPRALASLVDVSGSDELQLLDDTDCEAVASWAQTAGRAIERLVQRASSSSAVGQWNPATTGLPFICSACGVELHRERTRDTSCAASVA